MPLRQLKTLNSILETKENVFLLAHIAPTSSSCNEIYGTLFRGILTRHSNKIKGQFYGHTHQDQFIVNTDPRDNKTSTSFGFLGGSLSPLATGQPRFRIY
jgi:sphingomyelin phosphodiesterase